MDCVFSYKTKIIVFLILGFVTVFSALFFDRYQDCGPEMLKDADFEQGSAYWKVEKGAGCQVNLDDGVLHIASSESNRNILVWQPVKGLEQVFAVRVKALIRCKDVVPGNKVWNKARMIMTQHDGTTTQWKRPHTVALFSGTSNWERYNSSFVIAPDTRELRVAAQLAHCTGAIEIKDLSLTPVRQTPWYGWAQKMILSAWGIYLVHIFGSCIGSGKKNFPRILFVLSFALILFGTSMPGRIKKQISQDFKEQVYAYSSESIDTVQNIEQIFHNLIPWDISKIAHLVLFIGFGLILSSIMPSGSGAYVMLNLMFFAGATEFIQFYIDGRTPLPGDFVIDSTGGLVGLFLAKSIQVFSDRKR
ncbi:MAG: VanZ family protein [Desulfobacterium sp.]|nr:VanZ family protein [Desulfobacterium sp.]